MPALIPLAPAHAAEAARLHMIGQPGTFLTSLGPEVLGVFYATLPRSPFGFGYALVEPGSAGRLTGFVAATTSTAALFLEMGTLRLPAFAPPLLQRFMDAPDLLPRAAQTLIYPLLAQEQSSLEGAAGAAPARRSAELLAIMVEPEARGCGAGAVLLQVLAEECQRRSIDRLDVTVDADNAGARRFYARHGFTQRRTFPLYGRAMCLYALELSAELVPDARLQ